jgi:uncharacterized protein YabE (DUF348 family)
MFIAKKSLGRAVALLMALCVLAGCLVACGGKEVTLSVIDYGNPTEVKAAAGDTVSKILEANNIKLGDKDETVPAVSEAITAETTEILIKRYAKVTVVYGNDKKEVEIIGGTVEAAIKSAGFKVEDGVTPDADPKAYLKDGMVIMLSKTAKVKLTTADGKTTEVTTKAATVKEFLEEQKIVIGENDTVSPKLTDKITNGMNIVITHKEAETKATEAATEAPQAETSAPAQDDNNSSNEGGSNESDNSGSDNEPEPEPQSGDDGGSSGGSDGGSQSGGEKTVVSRQDMPDCDGSGHGYVIVTWSDGSVTYEEY